MGKYFITILSLHCEKEKIDIKFLLASMISSGFLPVSICGQLSEQFLGSQAAHGTPFRVTCGYRKAETFPEEDTRQICHS